MGGLHSIRFGLVFSFLILVSFGMPCAQRACVLFCKVTSLYTMGALVTEETEKVELLSAAFASVFTVKAGPQASQSLEAREEAWRKEDLPLVEEDQVRYHLSNLDTHKSMAPMRYTHEC